MEHIKTTKQLMEYINNLENQLNEKETYSLIKRIDIAYDLDSHFIMKANKFMPKTLETIFCQLITGRRYNKFMNAVNTKLYLMSTFKRFLNIELTVNEIIDLVDIQFGDHYYIGVNNVYNIKPTDRIDYDDTKQLDMITNLIRIKYGYNMRRVDINELIELCFKYKVDCFFLVFITCNKTIELADLFVKYGIPIPENVYLPLQMDNLYSYYKKLYDSENNPIFYYSTCLTISANKSNLIKLKQLPLTEDLFKIKLFNLFNLMNYVDLFERIAINENIISYIVSNTKISNESYHKKYVSELIISNLMKLFNNIHVTFSDYESKDEEFIKSMEYFTNELLKIKNKETVNTYLNILIGLYICASDNNIFNWIKDIIMIHMNGIINLEIFNMMIRSPYLINGLLKESIKIDVKWEQIKRSNELFKYVKVVELLIELFNDEFNSNDIMDLLMKCKSKKIYNEIMKKHNIKILKKLTI